jgi:hypothetical protein
MEYFSWIPLQKRLKFIFYNKHDYTFVYYLFQYFSTFCKLLLFKDCQNCNVILLCFAEDLLTSVQDHFFVFTEAESMLVRNRWKLILRSLAMCKKIPFFVYIWWRKIKWLQYSFDTFLLMNEHNLDKKENLLLEMCWNGEILESQWKGNDHTLLNY